MKKKLVVLLSLVTGLSMLLCGCNSATDVKATIVNNEGVTEELSSHELYVISEENSAKFQKAYWNAQVTITGTVESVDSYRHSFFPCDMYQINLKEGWEIDVVAEFHEEVIDFAEGDKVIVTSNIQSAFTSDIELYNYGQKGEMYDNTFIEVAE